MLLSAQLEDEDERELFCTTILPGTDESCERLVQELNLIRPPSRSVMHMTTIHADGSQTLTTFI